MKYKLSDLLFNNDIIESIMIAKTRVDQQLRDKITDPKASYSFAQKGKPRPYNIRFNDAFIGVIGELIVTKILGVSYEPQYLQYLDDNPEPDLVIYGTSIEVRGTRNICHGIIRPHRDFQFKNAEKTLLCQVTNLDCLIIIPDNFSQASPIENVLLNKFWIRREIETGCELFCNLKEITDRYGTIRDANSKAPYALVPIDKFQSL